MAHFVKNDEKSTIWPKLATFRANYHVSAFLSTFEQEVAKSGSFGEGARKIIDLAKTSKFSRKVPCFGVVKKSSLRMIGSNSKFNPNKLNGKSGK